MSHARAGALISAVSIAKAFVPVFAGLLAACLGTRMAIMVGAALASVAVLSPHAPTFETLLGVRFVFGIGGAIIVTLMGAAVMEWFPKKERPMINGINNVAVNYGIMLVGWMKDFTGTFQSRLMVACAGSFSLAIAGFLLARAEEVGALEEDLVRTRAWIALDMWKLDEALAGFAWLVEVCPESSSCVLQATAFLQAGDQQGALQAALQAVAREPSDFRGFTYAGVACANLGRFDEARQYLERAAALQPRSPQVHHTLGWVALQQGDAEAAERHQRDAVRVDPLYVTSRRLLGDLCAGSGRAGEAREHYEAALEVFPGYAEVRDALAALDLPA